MCELCQCRPVQVLAPTPGAPVNIGLCRKCYTLPLAPLED